MPRSPAFRNLAIALMQAQGDAPPRRRISRQSLSRRRFLALFGAAATFTLAGARLPALASGGRRIAIIGAGVAGLGAAHRLIQAGFEPTLFEARDRVGGRIRTTPAPFDARLPIDLGAAFVNSDHDDLIGLCAALDVPLFRNEDGYAEGAPVSAFVFDGRVVPMAEVAADLAPVAAAIAADAARLDADWEGVAPEIDRMSVADWLDRHAPLIGKPYIRTLIEKAVRTEYGSEAADASALELMTTLPVVDGETVDVLGASDEAYMIDGGSSRLIEALLARVGDRVRLNAPVEGIADRGAGIEIMVAGRTQRFDAAVIATPFTLLRRMTIEAPLPEMFRRFVAEARLGRNEKIIAGFTGRPWRRAGLFGAEAWSDGAFASVWEDTIRNPDSPTGALTFFHGGAEVDGALAGGRRRAARARVEALEPFASGVVSAMKRDCARTAWSRDPWTRGAYSSFAPGQYTAFGRFMWIDPEVDAPPMETFPGPVFGNLAFAGEHLSDAHYGYMNGAIATSRMAADAIVRAAR